MQDPANCGLPKPDSAASSASKEVLSSNSHARQGYISPTVIVSWGRAAAGSIRNFFTRMKGRLPRGLEVPVMAAGLVLVLAASALALYGVIITTKALTGEHASASPEELFRRGYIGKGLAKGMRRVDAALDAHGAASLETGTAFIALARMLDSAGENDKAAAMLDQARIVIDSLADNDPQAAGRCSLDIAAAAMEMGDFQTAESAARRALELSAAAGVSALRIRSLDTLGAVLVNTEQFGDAFTAYRDAVDAAAAHGLEPSAEEASLRLNAARAALLSGKPQIARVMLGKPDVDKAKASDEHIPDLALRGIVLEARIFSVENECAKAVRLASFALGNAESLPPESQRTFARNAGQDMLATMRRCATDAATSRPVMLFLERLAAFFDTALAPGNSLRIQALQSLAELSTHIGRPERTLALDARLLDAQSPPPADRRGKGLDSLLDHDAQLMRLLAQLAIAESPPQDIATLAFGAWLSRRVLFPPTGIPALGALKKTSDEALLQEFNHLAAAIANTAHPVRSNGRTESALLTNEAHERLTDLSQAIAERRASLKPLLQWTIGRNDGYADAVRSLSAALPEHGGMLFFARTRPVRQSSGGADEGPHVLAFLLARSQDADAAGAYVHVLDIGTVRNVEKTVAAWREARLAGDEEDTAAVTLGLAEVELYSLLWAPIRKAAPELRTIWIGPSDPPSRNLAQLPYGTLPTPEGKPLSAAMNLRRVDRDELLASMHDSAEPSSMVGLLDAPAR